MPLDNEDGYNQIGNKIKAAKTYIDSKSQYDEARKKSGDSFEKKKSSVKTQIGKLKKQQQAFQRELKTQFEQLLDIGKLTGGKSTSTTRYLKRTFIKTLNKVRPEIERITINEIVNALGCDQQQTYNPGQIIYIKVKSIDFKSILKIDPESDVGKTFYESKPIQIQNRPFSMNRELYQRIQSGQPYSVDNNQLYIGASGQNLFDIQYFDTHPITGVPGGWFGVTLQTRVNNLNIVFEFLKDYYKTVLVFDFANVIASIIDSLCGAVSIQADFGLEQTKDATIFSLFIQRVLGLCFDNAKEIDVSGISKLSDFDNIDESFFELTDIDLRKIEERISNLQNRVVEFEDCDNIKVPVNAAEIVGSLNNLTQIDNLTDLENAADQITNTITSNPNLGGLQFNANIQAAIDLDFIKLIIDGLIKSILSPKMILPLMTMAKAIQTNVVDPIVDEIENFQDFYKKFKKFMINLISKIGALFVQTLFELIKQDLYTLLQSIVRDLQRERVSKQYIMIVKLVQLLIVVSQLINDYRSCKSIIDELLKILNIITNGSGFGVPGPLLTLSRLLDGYSATRAFINTIEELQSLGIPTGPMPDGSPNLSLLSRLGQLKAQQKEQLENGKTETFIVGGTSLPTGTVTPIKIYGKSY